MATSQSGACEFDRLFNKSVPNIRDVQDDGQVPWDDLSRRDLSARFDAEEGDHVITNFELGTQRSVEKSPQKEIETTPL